MVMVAPDRTLRGVSSVSSLDPPLGVGLDGLPVRSTMVRVPFGDVMVTSYDSDAHLVSYEVVLRSGDRAPEFPRIRKEALSQVRSLGGDVTCDVVVLDVDLKDLGFPPDASWFSVPRDSWPSVRSRVLGASPSVGPWTWAYSTLRGLRLAHSLLIPVPAGAGYEALLRRFHDSYHAAGVPVDRRCSDWTRLYRCPSVSRLLPS